MRTLSPTCVLAVLLAVTSVGVATAQVPFASPGGTTVRSFNGLLVTPRNAGLFRSLFYLQPRPDEEHPFSLLDATSCTLRSRPQAPITWVLHWQTLAFPCAGRPLACRRPVVLADGALRTRAPGDARVELPPPDWRIYNILSEVTDGCCLTMQVTGRPVAGPRIERLAMSCGADVVDPWGY